MISIYCCGIAIYPAIDLMKFQWMAPCFKVPRTGCWHGPAGKPAGRPARGSDAVRTARFDFAWPMRSLASQSQASHPAYSAFTQQVMEGPRVLARLNDTAMAITTPIPVHMYRS